MKGARRLHEVVLVLAVIVASARWHADAQARPQVSSLLMATRDVWDVAYAGDTLLVATSGGLVVEDASGRAVLGASEGLLGTRCRSLSLLGDGSVWVGGVDGATRLVRGRDGRFAAREQVALRRVTRVVEHEGELLFATAADGLFRLEQGRPVAIPFPGSAHARKRLQDMLVARGELYVASAGAGVFVLDRTRRIVRRHSTTRGLPDDVVWDLEADGVHVLAATLRGVAELRSTRAVPRELPASLAVHDVRALRVVHEVNRTGMWIVTFGGGARWVPSRGESTGDETSESRVSCYARALAPRAEGGAWLATTDGLRAVDARGTLTCALHGDDAGEHVALPTADVTALERAFGKLWIGTFDRGLVAFDGAQTTQIEGRRWQLDARVNDLAVTRDASTGMETLWIATDRGLFASDGRVVSPAVLPASLRDVHVTAIHAPAQEPDTLWMTSALGLFHYDGARWSDASRVPGQALTQLHAVTVDASGRIWAGGLRGLVAIDPRTREATRLSVASGALPVDWVTALVPYRGGVIVGTYHGGLVAIDEDMHTRVVREGEHGLVSGWVNAHALAVRDDGTLLVGTLDRGLALGAPGAFTSFTTRDALPSDDVTDFLVESPATVLVATRGGLARLSWR